MPSFLATYFSPSKATTDSSLLTHTSSLFNPTLSKEVPRTILLTTPFGTTTLHVAVLPLSVFAVIVAIPPAFIALIFPLLSTVTYDLLLLVYVIFSFASFGVIFRFNCFVRPSSKFIISVSNSSVETDVLGAFLPHLHTPSTKV